MFEIERLKDGVTYRYGAKGKWQKVSQEKADAMKTNALGLLYRVRIPDVLDVYVALDALDRDANLRRVKVVRGMVTEQVYDHSEVELPPEEPSGAEA